VGMFDLTMSEEAVREYRAQVADPVRPHIHGEDLVAAGVFRRGGSAGQFAASKAGGGLLYAAVSLARKKKAGGLPDQVPLAVTPERLYTFKTKYRGGRFEPHEEVAKWDRAGLRISTQPSMGLTNLTIESPAEGEKATLVPVGVKDDPVSLEVIAALQA
jgi:hypothetical protein